MSRDSRIAQSAMVLALAALLAGCSSTPSKPATGASRSPTSASRGTFVATWVPSNIDPTVYPAKVATLSWTSPQGKKGTVPVDEAFAWSGRNRDGATITLVSARASSYPNAYWPSFLHSTYWNRTQSDNRVIVYSPKASGGVVDAMFESEGYFVQASGSKVGISSMLRFVSDLRFQVG